MIIVRPSTTKTFGTASDYPDMSYPDATKPPGSRDSRGLRQLGAVTSVADLLGGVGQGAGARRHRLLGGGHRGLGAAPRGGGALLGRRGGLLGRRGGGLLGRRGGLLGGLGGLGL